MFITSFKSAQPFLLPVFQRPAFSDAISIGEPGRYVTSDDISFQGPLRADL
jgi:hypothetical protein